MVKQSAIGGRVVKGQNGFVDYPYNWPPYRNGSNEPCDMLQGPCCCGAWHKLDEWKFETVSEDQVITDSSGSGLFR